MAAANEDPSFLIYASVRKGYAAARSLTSAVALIHGPNGAILESVPLRDDGLCKYCTLPPKS